MPVQYVLDAINNVSLSYCGQQLQVEFTFKTSQDVWGTVNEIDTI